MTNHLTIQDGFVFKTIVQDDFVLYVRLPIEKNKEIPLSAQELLDSITEKEVN